MKIERRRIEDLQLDPDNAREHDDANLEAIKSSLGKFGQRKPIVVADGVVIAGNGTMLAAQALGWKEIDTVSADDLDELERKAYAIADNRTAELAKWNQEKLAQALADITEIGDELGEASGFDHEAIVDLVSQELGDSGEPAEIVEDEVPEVEEETVTQPGDLWVLSRHRLLCGDSTKQEDVERLMAGQRAAMMIADPPYNVGYEYSDHEDNLSSEDYQAFCDAYLRNGAAVSEMQVITPGKSNERRYDPKEYMTWFKGFGLSRGSFYKAMVTEPILLFGKKPKNRFYSTDHFHIGTEREPGLRELHTCPKPVKLFAALIEPMTESGDIVFEAFLGSGTTLVAAEQLGRRCYGIEFSPTYCDVIVRRWQKLTGQRAVNEATGELFPE